MTGHRTSTTPGWIPSRDSAWSFVEQFFVGCRALLQSAKVLEVTLAVLDRRWRIGALGFLWPATAIFGCSAASRSSASIQLRRLSGVVSPTYMWHWL
ncbi:MAG: hypothetical protein QOC85_3874 [Streptomyces sp.]|jgi:hypothetical protein|nr:hypothetical protein [Streptomyces sp.]